LFLKACFLFVTCSHRLFPCSLPIHCLFACSLITSLLARFSIRSSPTYLLTSLFAHCLPTYLLASSLSTCITCHLSPTCITCFCCMVIYMSPIQVPTKPITLGSSSPSIWYYPFIYLCRF
jgi:hypothetical protein